MNTLFLENRSGRWDWSFPELATWVRRLRLPARANTHSLAVKVAEKPESSQALIVVRN